MAIDLLSRLSGWKISGGSRDVRGLQLQDGSGGSLGAVRDLMVNTETGEVERLVLDNLAEYPACCVEVAGDGLQLRRDEFMAEGTSCETTGTEATLRVRCERV